MPLFSFLRRKGDSNPRYPYEYDSLANCWFQPLTHLSFVGSGSHFLHFDIETLRWFLVDLVVAFKSGCKSTAYF